MAEEEKVITVENKGGKGNPNHAPAGAPESKGGQFVSKEEAEVGTVSTEPSFKDDDIGIMEIQKAPQSAIGSKFASFLNKKKEEREKEAIDFIGGVKDSVDENHQKFYSELSREEKLALLYDSPVGYDKKKLKFATDGQLTALLYAEAVANKRVQLEQELITLEKQRDEIKNAIDEKLKLHDIDIISGVWKDENGYWVDKRPSDYVFLSTSGSIDRKKEYYNGVLANPDSSVAEKFKATQKLKELEGFIESGKEYEEMKKSLMLANYEVLEGLETKIGEASLAKKTYEDNVIVLENAKKYTDSFIDIESTYSQERKNKATWFKGLQASFNHYSGKASEHWNSMSYLEKLLVKEYTGSGYSRFNKPLRGINHEKYGYSFGGEGMETFSEAVNNLSSAIDKCTWDEDIWLNRYIGNNTRMFRLPGETGARTLESMSDSELQSLVGTSFTDGGFFSAGAAKGTGYHTGDIVFNVYCPKGTHMLYAAPYTAASKSENEMILQRGYSFRITKVERHGGSYYLDMEVILGSDANKPMGNDLKKLGNEHYYKPRGEKGEDYD